MDRITTHDFVNSTAVSLFKLIVQLKLLSVHYCRPIDRGTTFESHVLVAIGAERCGFDVVALVGPIVADPDFNVGRPLRGQIQDVGLNKNWPSFHGDFPAGHEVCLFPLRVQIVFSVIKT